MLKSRIILFIRLHFKLYNISIDARNIDSEFNLPHDFQLLRDLRLFKIVGGVLLFISLLIFLVASMPAQEEEIHSNYHEKIEEIHPNYHEKTIDEIKYSIGPLEKMSRWEIQEKLKDLTEEDLEDLSREIRMMLKDLADDFPLTDHIVDEEATEPTAEPTIDLPSLVADYWLYANGFVLVLGIMMLRYKYPKIALTITETAIIQTQFNKDGTIKKRIATPLKNFKIIALSQVKGVIAFILADTHNFSQTYNLLYLKSRWSLNSDFDGEEFSKKLNIDYINFSY